MTNIDKLGEQIKAQVKARDAAQKQTETYLERRKAATEIMRPLVAEVRAAFERGETVNGKTQWTDWCAWANPTCKHPARWFQMVLAPKKEKSVVRVLDNMKISLRGLTLDAGEGLITVEFEKARIETYKGKINERRDSSDWSQTPAAKDGTIDWLHKTKEIDGVVSFTVEDKTLTEKQVVGELLKKMKAGLKAMHLWDDKLVGDYKEYVKEHNEYAEEQKESRSRSAKKAAETRKKKPR